MNCDACGTAGAIRPAEPATGATIIVRAHHARDQARPCCCTQLLRGWPARSLTGSDASGRWLYCDDASNSDCRTLRAKPPSSCRLAAGCKPSQTAERTLARASGLQAEAPSCWMIWRRSTRPRSAAPKATRVKTMSGTGRFAVAAPVCRQRGGRTCCATGWQSHLPPLPRELHEWLRQLGTKQPDAGYPSRHAAGNLMPDVIVYRDRLQLAFRRGWPAMPWTGEPSLPLGGHCGTWFVGAAEKKPWCRTAAAQASTGWCGGGSAGDRIALSERPVMSIKTSCRTPVSRRGNAACGRC